MKPLGAVTLMAILFAVPGCLFEGCEVDPGPDYWDEPDVSTRSPWDAGTPNQAPSFTAIELPSYPPLGPNGSVKVTLADDRGLSALGYQFAKSGSVYAYGTAQTIDITGWELGEGFGELLLTIYDTGGAWTRKAVESLVVDLSPPKVEVMPRSVMRPREEVVAWVSDGWLLGSVELEIGEVTMREDFPAVYPPYFGEQWDVSLVRFAIGNLKDGIHPARLTVRDAAGNSVTRPFDLTIDGTPPEVSVLSPAPGSTVSGRFLVEVAADDGGGEVDVILFLDGLEIAQASGPLAAVTLDAADFASGTLDLEVQAVDAAGNVASVTLPLTVAP